VTKPVPAPKPAPITAPVTPKPAAAAAPVAAPVAAAPTAPTSLPKTLEIKDAQGRVIGTMPNPEATTPLTVPAPAKAAPAEKKPDLLSQIINTVLSLALVLVLAYLALLGLKRLGAGSTRPPAAAGSARLFRVLESQTLAPGCSVHVVLVGTQVLLVGQTGQQVTVLRDLTGDPVVQAAMQQGAGGGGFLAALSRFLTPAGAPPAGQGIPLADYVRGQRPSPPPEEDGR
jgi:flagellar biogenesis protein FliO